MNNVKQKAVDVRHVLETQDYADFFRDFMTINQRYLWTAGEVADALRIGEGHFIKIRATHKFYAPDSFKSLDPEKPAKRAGHNKDPLWSCELVALIIFARRVTPQGVRQLTDDEGLMVRNGLGEKRRRYYMEVAEQYQ